MKIQADIPNELNKKLKMVKLVNDFKDLPETMIKVLDKILSSSKEFTLNKMESFEIKIKKEKK